MANPRPPSMETLRTSLLKQILRNLDWYDLQSAMQVCRRWEKVAFWMQGVQTLEKFMQFCEDLMVPSISVVSKHYALNCDYLSREYIACNIRKLSIHALEINPCACDHLIQSMRNLHTLELTLQKPLDQSIYQGICTRNPQCEINRHWYKPYNFESV
nr:uncharacterized protein LOC109420706 [Aedes albopictus]